MVLRRTIKIISSLVLFFVFVFVAGAQQVNVNVNIPGVQGSAGPCEAIFGFYKFALMIGGVLALGAITYGGVKYTLAAGNPAGQSEGKEWVKGALLGLLLLVGAWLILNVINPDLTKCTVPTLEGISASPGGGDGGGGGTPSGQVRQSTLDEIEHLKQYCGSSCVQVNSTVTGDHQGGTCSHANGYKADIQNNDCINNCIRSNQNFSYVRDRAVGEPCYQDNANGNTYVYEPSTNGGRGHWDMNSCPSVGLDDQCH